MPESADQSTKPKAIRVETVLITSALYDNGVRELSVGVRSELEGVPATMNEDELKGVLINAMLNPSIDNAIRIAFQRMNNEKKAD